MATFNAYWDGRWDLSMMSDEELLDDATRLVGEYKVYGRGLLGEAVLAEMVGRIKPYDDTLKGCVAMALEDGLSPNEIHEMVGRAIVELHPELIHDKETVGAGLPMDRVLDENPILWDRDQRRAALQSLTQHRLAPMGRKDAPVVMIPEEPEEI